MIDYSFHDISHAHHGDTCMFLCVCVCVRVQRLCSGNDVCMKYLATSAPWSHQDLNKCDRICEKGPF